MTREKLCYKSDGVLLKYGKELTKSFIFGLLLVFNLALTLAPEKAECQSGEEVYFRLSQIANGKGDPKLFKTLSVESKKLDWKKSVEAEFDGTFRVIKPAADSGLDDLGAVYLLRKVSGEILILSLPADPALLKEGADSHYAGLEQMFDSKMTFKVERARSVVEGQTYDFARFVSKPERVMIEKVFKQFIALMLFFVMTGMGLTLTLKDFAIVFSNPRGIVIGQILQFGFMPLLAFALGRLMGFHEHYPFIFVGMILVTAIPGGVTSNLMTYYAKGDVALSISLTSFSSVLSIVFTPLLLSLYCSDMPNVQIPIMDVAETIFVLLIIPLAVGMFARSKWPAFAEKATPFFSALGIIALLILIVACVISNSEVFADTDRHGFRFYSTIFLLTFAGMIGGIILPKLFGINNYQTRAISLETGLRSVTLAMTVALLMQDAMGDFHSSMFITSGIFGLAMYLAGIISIFLYKSLLPVQEKQ